MGNLKPDVVSLFPSEIKLIFFFGFVYYDLSYDLSPDHCLWMREELSYVLSRKIEKEE